MVKIVIVYPNSLIYSGVSSNAAKRREGANEVEMTGT